jgi:hypothetical protein
MVSKYFLALILIATVIWTVLGFPGRDSLLSDSMNDDRLMSVTVSDGNRDQTAHDNHGHDTHKHGSLEVGGIGQPVPTVKLYLLKDPMSGWNANIVTENFRFAPENVSENHVPGEGHAHLYVDGVKVNRVYGPWYFIGPLSSGEHSVKVTISSNDHQSLTVDNVLISDTVDIIVD